jgi:TATA-binding protein-associated factor Taf7
MNKSELKDLVKRYFNLTEITTSEDTITEKFTEAKLADGTVITNMVDADFEVGQELHVITAEGEHVLAPSGEHTTESGIVITVDEAGVITGVKHPDEEGEGSLEAGEEEYMSSEEVAEEKTEMAEHGDEEEVVMEESSVEEAIVEAIAEIVAPQIEEMKQKMAEMEEKMNSAFASTPASNPTMEAKFSKENKKELDFLNTKFDFKKAQLDSILGRTKK